VRRHRSLILIPALDVGACLAALALFGTLALVTFPRSVILGLGILATLVIVVVVLDTVAGAALVVASEQVLLVGSISMADTWRRCWRTLGPLVAWSGIRAGVGSALSVVRGDGSGGGGSGGLLLRGVLAAAGGVAWGIISFFVVPVLVFESVGPMAAIRRSAQLARQRWGAQLTGTVRIGAIVGLVTVLPGILLALAGLALLADPGQTAPWLALPSLAIGCVAVLVGVILIGTLRGVFSVVLYRYATTGEAVGEFGAADLTAAFSSAR
jgi:hypothetical protein